MVYRRHGEYRNRGLHVYRNPLRIQSTQDLTIHTNDRTHVTQFIKKKACIARLSADKKKVILETKELDDYEAEPVKKLKKLIDGKVKSTNLTLIIPTNIDFVEDKPDSYRGVRARRFVYPTRTVSDEEVSGLEDIGLEPIQKDKGETTRIQNFRISTRMKNNLRSLKRLIHESTGKEIEDSELIRLLLLKSVKQAMQDPKGLFRASKQNIQENSGGLRKHFEKIT